MYFPIFRNNVYKEHAPVFRFTDHDGGYFMYLCGINVTHLGGEIRILPVYNAILNFDKKGIGLLFTFNEHRLVIGISPLGLRCKYERIEDGFRL